MTPNTSFKETAAYTQVTSNSEVLCDLIFCPEDSLKMSNSQDYCKSLMNPQGEKAIAEDSLFEVTWVYYGIAALIALSFTMLSTLWSTVHAAAWPTPVPVILKPDLQAATTNLQQAITSYTYDPSAANLTALQNAQAAFRTAVANASPAAALIVDADDSIPSSSGSLDIIGPLAASIQVTHGATLSIDNFNPLGSINMFNVFSKGGALDIDADEGSQILFSNNSSLGSGGAVNSGGNNNTLSINNAKFEGNSALLGGGVNNASSTASISNSSFTGNTANLFGGGISNDNGTMSVINSSFVANMAAAGGGFDNSNNSNATVINSSFSENSAFGGGGGISNFNSALNVINTNLTGNTTDGIGGGGGINNIFGTLNLINSSLTGNTATGIGGGGGISNTAGLLNLINTSFTENSATGLVGGGAISVFGNSILNIVNSSFERNSAISDGGAIFNEGSTLNLIATAGNQTIFTGNSINGAASSISFLSLFTTPGLNAAVESNGLLDMRDPMEVSFNLTSIDINKFGAGTWALGGTNLFTQFSTGMTNFNVQEGVLYLYGQNEVTNATGNSPDAMVGTGNIQLDGSSSLFSVGSGATLVAGGANSISTDGTISFADGSTIRGANANTALGGNNPNRYESGGVTSLNLSAGGGIALNGSVSLAALAAGDQLSVSGVLGGTGGLNKIGEGIVILQGNNNYTGNTLVNAGTLLINGDQSVASGTTTVNQGILGGHGIIGGDVQLLGGNISPGNSIGTLTILGNYTQNTGSTYMVELNTTGQSDLLVVNGSATINGGTVQAIATNGNYIAGKRYTILNAKGGVSGHYDNLSENLPFLDLTLLYDTNNIYLDVVRSSLAFAAFAATVNQRNTANAIESMLPFNPVFIAVANLTTVSQAQQAFNALSGEGYVSVLSVLTEASRYLREATLNRLQQTLDKISLLPAKEPFQANGWGLWAQGYGAWGELEGNRNAAGVDRRNQGFFIGLDRGFARYGRFGIIAGYSHSDIDMNARRTSADLENYSLGVYGGTLIYGASFRAGAAYTWHRVDINRQVVFSGFFNPLTSDYNAYSRQGFAEIAYPLNLKRLGLEPFVGLAYVDVSSERWVESGGAAALTAKGSQSTPYSTLGLREASVFYQGEGFAVDEQLTLGWQHAYHQATPKATFSFISGSSPFSIYGAPIAQNALMLDASLNWYNQNRSLNFRVSYNGQLANQARDQAVTAYVAWYLD